MQITVKVNDKIEVEFKGKINMIQTVILEKKDAFKLGEILKNQQSTTFTTN